MARAQRTYCRTCGAQLRLPWWKALIGLNIATCHDVAACTARLYAKRPDLDPRVDALEDEHRRMSQGERGRVR